MEIVDLALARKPTSPKDTFLNLAAFCEENGINDADVYGDLSLDSASSWLKRFEEEVRTRLGKSGALFLVSGIMSQGIAAKIHSNRTGSSTIICHHSSHVILHEQNTFPTLLGLTPVVIAAAPGQAIQQPISYSDVSSLLDADPAPAMLLVECPHREIGGKCTSYEDLELMSAHCRRRGVAFHCDGARLWEAEAAYCTAETGRSLQDLCNLFDSIYVSFYKGLGGITGAMLLGSNEFISEARVWQRRFGGNLYCQMPMALSSWAGFLHNGPEQFILRKTYLSRIMSALTASFAEACRLNDQGLPLVRFDPPVPCVSLIHIYIRATPAEAIAARDLVVAESGIRVFTRLRPSSLPDECYLEMNLGPHNLEIAEEVWLRGWTMFVDCLKSGSAIAK